MALMSQKLVISVISGAVHILRNRGWGGLPDLLQYYKGEGGVSRDPKFVLRNIWTAPNKSFENYLSDLLS